MHSVSPEGIMLGLTQVDPHFLFHFDFCYISKQRVTMFTVKTFEDKLFTVTQKVPSEDYFKFGI